MTTKDLGENTFVRHYDLDLARRFAKTAREPKAHQVEALNALNRWFVRSVEKGASRGALLVLPTGGGKTLTAIRFLCAGPLSEGYKVLWLAHTHHLLEQAFETLGPAKPTATARVEVSQVRAPREQLRVRVVSGTPRHARVPSIRPDDDVLIGSLQSISGAHREGHSAFVAFTEAAGRKLIVVFDEAHHAPAPTYARFIEDLRYRVPDLPVLGLTATPVYADKLRSGWLGKLFPQGIAYQVTAQKLMAAGILAEPIVEECRTHVEAEFDSAKFARWSETYADLPDDIVTKLADNSARNDLIVQHYIANRKKYGKTLIFADRWFQCEYLATNLRKRGVRADVVYSHVDARGGTVEERSRRTPDDNSKAIAAFKDGTIDVLVNVRMLTEGTDVPSVQSVFLTRQTTSKVLMTQMVGRALRGPAFGGTSKAYVVSFIDDWRQLINWADFSLVDGAADDNQTASRKRLPVQLVSIELVRQLSEQMHQPVSQRPATFLQLLPVGWYRTAYDAQIEGAEDIEHQEPLVLVYDHDREGFETLQKALVKENLAAFVDPGVTLESCRARVQKWVERFFPEHETHLGGDLVSEVFHIVRHLAQTGERPPFFAFEERENHDLDMIATDAVQRNIGLRDVASRLRNEYERQDRFWRSLYGTFELFYRQFNLVSERVSNELVLGGQPDAPVTAIATHPEQYTDLEPPAEMKENVKRRDGYRCLCCGADDKRYLEVDHITAQHHGGRNELENLQTLCRRCNGDKGVNEMNFRRTQTAQRAAHPDFDVRRLPADVADRTQWERCVRATINHYYRCAAVSAVEIGARGTGARAWTIKLNAHNDPRFLEAYLPGLLARIQMKRGEKGYVAPVRLSVLGSSSDGTLWATEVDDGEPTVSARREA